MPRKYNSSELGFGDWHDFFANGISAVILGVIVGGLFGWQTQERLGIPWGCFLGFLLFFCLGFWKQIWYFLRFLFFK